MTALQAATEIGGFDLALAFDADAEFVREYFTRESLDRMFPGEDNTTCGGHSLAECADAVIEELGIE